MRHLIAVVILLELLGSCSLPQGEGWRPALVCSPAGPGQVCTPNTDLFGPYRGGLTANPQGRQPRP